MEYKYSMRMTAATSRLLLPSIRTSLAMISRTIPLALATEIKVSRLGQSIRVMTPPTIPPRALNSALIIFGRWRQEPLFPRASPRVGWNPAGMVISGKGLCSRLRGE